jgi:hypothetical protein
VGPGAGLVRCEKSHPTGIRSPDRAARSESLYRLRYPDYTDLYFTFLYALWYAMHMNSIVRTNLLLRVSSYLIVTSVKRATSRNM